MFCPNCHYEYQPGVAVCPDCGAELIAELPPIPPTPPKVKHPDEPSQLITVFETYALPEIAIAKSILEEAGIYFISGNQMAEAAYFTGPLSIMVAREDAGRAHELLANLAMDRMLDEQMEKMTFDDESDHSDDNK